MANKGTSRRQRQRGRSRGPLRGGRRPTAVEQFPIPAALVEHMLLGPADDRRVLQDSPILGDVWLAYAADPASIQDLLITPHKDVTAAEVASEISRAGSWPLRRGPGCVFAGHRGRQAALRRGAPRARATDAVVGAAGDPERSSKWKSRRQSATAPARFWIRSAFALRARRWPAKGLPLATRILRRSTDTSPWLGSYFGSACSRPRTRSPKRLKLEVEKVFPRYENKIDEIVNGMLALYETIKLDSAELATKLRDGAPEQDAERETPLIFQVSLNRRASPALEKSVPAVKADAARTLFEVKCDKIVWAVLDSGIDATHEAFLFPGRMGREASRASGRRSISPGFARSSAATMRKRLDKTQRPLG